MIMAENTTFTAMLMEDFLGAEVEQGALQLVLYFLFDKKELDRAREIIITHNIDVNLFLFGQSLLTKAIRDGFLEGVNFLISFDVNVNQQFEINHMNNMVLTPLMIAVSYGQLEIITILIKNGANVNYQDPIQGCSPLMLACFKNNIEVVRLLLNAYANPTIKNKLNATAYDLMKFAGRREIMQLLKDAEKDFRKSKKRKHCSDESSSDTSSRKEN